MALRFSVPRSAAITIPANHLLTLKLIQTIQILNITTEPHHIRPIFFITKIKLESQISHSKSL